MAIIENRDFPWEQEKNEAPASAEGLFSAEGLSPIKNQLRQEFDLPETVEWDQITEAARDFDEHLQKTMSDQERLCAEFSLPMNSSWEDITKAARQKEDVE